MDGESSLLLLKTITVMLIGIFFIGTSYISFHLLDQIFLNNLYYIYVKMLARAFRLRPCFAFVYISS